MFPGWPAWAIALVVMIVVVAVIGLPLSYRRYMQETGRKGARP